MSKLDNLLQRLETKIPLYITENKEVSQANVGWHIEHSLLTLNQITKALLKSNPEKYKWKFNFLRIVFLTLKIFPRGRAKAPDVARPKGDITSQSLIAHLSETRTNLNELKHVSKNSYFYHPYFGKLNRKPALQFLELHTNHHLKIIEDIIKGG